MVCLLSFILSRGFALAIMLNNKTEILFNFISLIHLRSEIELFFLHSIFLNEMFVLSTYIILEVHQLLFSRQDNKL